MSTTIESNAETARSNGKAPESSPKKKRSKKAKNDAPQELSSAPLKTSASAGAPPSVAAAAGVCWRGDLRKMSSDKSASLEGQWSKFAKLLSKRPSLGRLTRSKRCPLSWSLDNLALGGVCQRLVDLLSNQGRRKTSAKRESAETEADQPWASTIEASINFALNHWLDWAHDAPNDAQLAVSCLAAACLIQEHARKLESELAWQSLDFLWQIAVDALAWQASGEATADAALAQQLFAAELPLTLSFVFAEAAPMHALRPLAIERLAAGLEELLDGDGLVRADHWPAARPLLGSWTRCATMCKRFKKGSWKRATRMQYVGAVRQALRWTADDGRPFLTSATGEAPKTDELLSVALKLADDKRAAAAAKRRWSALKSKTAKPAKSARRAKRVALAPADESEWSSLALLRADWAAGSPAIAVDYSQRAVQVDLWNLGRRIACGPWTTRSLIDGVELTAAGPWEQACWFSDADVDYLELCQDLAQGLRLERQIMLGRRDRVLLLCDHLQSTGEGLLEHQWSLPLDAAAAFEGEAETRDGLLRCGKRALRVFPLALPEWRIDPRGGELQAVDGRLALRQQRRGAAIACPLWIDLDPRRSACPSTWRQLTVAQGLAIQSPDAAVSYRVQSGGDQWVVYRSQGPRGNRTFLGQNTSSEFVAGRFLANKGEIRELVEVEC